MRLKSGSFPIRCHLLLLHAAIVRHETKGLALSSSCRLPQLLFFLFSFRTNGSAILHPVTANFCASVCVSFVLRLSRSRITFNAHRPFGAIHTPSSAYGFPLAAARSLLGCGPLDCGLFTSSHLSTSSWHTSTRATHAYARHGPLPIYPGCSEITLANPTATTTTNDIEWFSLDAYLWTAIAGLRALISHSCSAHIRTIGVSRSRLCLCVGKMRAPKPLAYLAPLP